MDLVLLAAPRAQKKDPPSSPIRFKEAVDAFRRRVPLPEDEFNMLSGKAKRQAFTVAGVTNLQVLAKVWTALDKAVAEGHDFAKFKKAVGGALAKEWGGKDSARVETIFRTNVMAAYNAGRMSLFTEAATIKRRPYLRWNAVHDSRVCPECAKLDGTVLPASDIFWFENQPPIHPNDRCQLDSLTKDEALEEGIDEEGPDVDVVDGFGGLPDMDWKPDLSNYPTPLADAFRAREKKAPIR